MKYALFFALTFALTQTHYANAQVVTVARTPSGSGTYQNVVYTINLDGSQQSVCDSNHPGSTYWTISSPQGATAPEQYLLSQDTGIFTLSANSQTTITQIVANCDDSEGSLANIDYDGGNTLFILDPNALPINNDVMWSGGTFFGSTSPMQVFSYVATGVITTGPVFWPFFQVVGVVLVFYILELLHDFIQKSVILGQSSKLSSKWPWLDRTVYLPYRGYKRLRSRKWNQEHTLK